jgi:type II secretory pathway component PulF
MEYYDSRGAPPTRTPSFVPWILAEIGWFLLCTAGGALGVIAIGFMLGLSLGYGSVLLVLLTIVALAVRARVLRRSRAMVAVNYLEQAVRLNLPIPQMLAAAGAGERRPIRRRLDRLRSEIESGSLISIALQRASPGVPPRVIGLISAGERLGRLPEALRRTATTERGILRDRRRALQGIMLRWYPMLVVVVVLPVYFILIIFVIPKFERIFRDFGLQLPGVTLWLLRISKILSWPLVIAATLGMMIAFARLYADLFPRHRPRLRRFGPFDWLAWTVPPWRGIVRSHAMADACHVIADALGAGQPVDRALVDAAEVSPNVVFRAAMQEWARYTSEGVPLAQAAQQARIPPLVTGMLRTSRDSTGTAEVFTFLSRYYDGRHSKAAALLEGAAIPIMVLCMAALVLTLALGLFLPMVKLMEHLSSNRWVI